MGETPDYIRAMQAPSFYPHAVEEVLLRETHISWVFLTGAMVYKVKKPVNMGFLDFTSLARRKHYCRQEVALNRRLAADVYREVVAITAADGGFRLGGDHAPIDYAVKMRQLPSGDALKRRLAANQVDAAALDRLAAVLAAFYREAASGAAVDVHGSPETIARNCEENFDQTVEAAGWRFDRRSWEVVTAATRGFLEHRDGLLRKRVARGFIRDGHGDLRTDHVYLTADGVRVIDCIEFNERFRCGDVACDLAFLAMELDDEGHAAAAGGLIDAFVRHSGDLQLYALLDFYKCYRAMVRLKVNCLRLEQDDVGDAEKTSAAEAIERYMALAYRYAVRFSRPVLWVVWGFVATGKSTLSRALAEVLDICVLRSDLVRKQRFARGAPDDTIAGFGKGIYSRQATALTYGKLLRLAQTEIESGRSVVLDATFSRRDRRREALRLAAETGAAIVFVECTCAEATLRRRLAARAGTRSVSDARLQHFDDLLAAFEAGDELPARCRMRVNTEEPLESGLRKVFAQLQVPNDCIEAPVKGD